MKEFLSIAYLCFLSFQRLCKRQTHYPLDVMGLTDRFCKNLESLVGLFVVDCEVKNG